MDINSDSGVANLVKKKILTDFKTISNESHPKDLIITDDDSDYVKNILAEYDLFKNRTRALNKKPSVIFYNKLYYRRIKFSVIHQGFVSKTTINRFHFQKKELIQKIIYRKLIKEFVSDNVFGDHSEVIIARIIAEAKNGKRIDSNQLSDDYYVLFNELKQLVGSGELTIDEESEGWLELKEIQSRDSKALDKEKAKKENLCYFILDQSPINADLFIINRNKLLSLSTSNLEKFVSLICKALNLHNTLEIKLKKMESKKKIAKSKYIPKKASTASQKLALIKKYKSEGKNQREVADLVGCCERTVRNYWNR